MLPIVEVPEIIRNGMLNYRDVFCRYEGFDHVSRYVTGLIISPNKTLHVKSCTQMAPKAMDVIIPPSSSKLRKLPSL